MAQQPDSVQVPQDTTPVKKPVRRVPRPVVQPPVIIPDSQPSAPVKPRFRIKEFQSQLQDHPYFNFSGTPLQVKMEPRKQEGNETLFYVLLGLLLYFSLIKLLFGKYLDNLLTLFFRVTMRQQQLREQLVGAPLPSLLLNFLFVINAGLYLSFLSEYYNFLPQLSIWTKAGYGLLLVSSIYFVKWIILKLAGWIFNATAATDTYIFVVFLVNKMIGIFLLPLLLVMAFAHPVVMSVLVVISYLMLGAFFSYRFIIAFRPVRSEIKVNRFHFFIYLCAFEIAPLLLIYKVLLDFVERSF